MLITQPYSYTLFFIFLTYYWICVVKKQKILLTTLVLTFIGLAFFLRIQVPPEMSKDYIAYSQIEKLDQLNVSLYSFFLEPYRHFLVKILNILSSDKNQVVLMYYYVNLIINSMLFIWIARIKDMSTWRKLLFFSLYYVVFSYVWLRAGIAYLIISYFIYYGFRNKIKPWGFAAPLFHLSSLPIIYLWLLKYVRVSLRPVLIIILILSLLLFISSEYSYHLTGKINQYIETGESKDNILHHAYFSTLTTLFIIYLFHNKKHLSDYFILSLYLLYSITHFTNVVAGQRLSHYLIITILFLPVDQFKKPLISNKKSGILAIFFIFIFYFKFSTVINFESY